MRIMTSSVLRAAYAAMTFCGMLSACEQPAASAAGAGQPYDITTQTRPASLEGYLNVYRGAHAACAFARKSMNLPPPAPFVDVPADFVTERITYLHDNGTYLTRRKQFFIDGPDAPEQGCNTRIASAEFETLVRDGTFASATRNSDGTLAMEPPEPLPPSSGEAAAAYSERSTRGGVAVRCLPPTHPANGIMPDQCVLDTAAGVPLDGHRSPVIVHMRSTLMERANVSFVTEPVRIQTGQPVDPARLAFSIGK